MAKPGALTEVTYEKDVKRWSRIKPFVAVENGVCLGFAELEDAGHINCFFVHHEHNRRGVGSLLMDACIKEARAHGYDKVHAEVSITAKPFFFAQRICIG